MARLDVVASISAIVCLAAVCLAASACEGNVKLFRPVQSTEPVLADAGFTPPPEPPLAVPTDVAPGGSSPQSPSQQGSTPVPSDEPSVLDAGGLGVSSEAGPPPALPRTVVANGPARELPRLGVQGGDPRLGVCSGGVVIGVRTTANPSAEVFGQRLTFIEPICGKVTQGSDSLGELSNAVTVIRDDAIVEWTTADGFLGVPATEVPDSRLLWVLQPATLCPDTAPIVVGLSGEYDPVAPDVSDTAAIRSLFIECAPLVLAPNGTDVVAAAADHQLIANADSFAAPGTTAYRSMCQAGTVLTQIRVDAGFWLDGFVLGCSTLSVE